MKLGLKPPRPGSISLELRKYINLSVLPTPPANFGHGKLVKTAWNMLGNDSVGNCVQAGSAHETILLNYEAGLAVPFDDACVISDYSAATGYNPADPNTDQGTDMQQYAAYRRNIGILDANGNRHKVGAYLAIQPGNLDEHLIAAYLFTAVGIGINFPSSAMDQFNTGEPWAPVAGSTIEGGHYVPLMGPFSEWLIINTWSRENPMTLPFFAANSNQSVTYVSSEFLTGGKSLEGFDLDQLNADLALLAPA